MVETLGVVEDLSLDSLEAGSRLQITAGDDPDSYRYDFLVIEPDETPRCMFMQTSPDGSLVGPTPVLLEGTGRWTTRKQNPVQTQEIAMTITWGRVLMGGLLVVIDAKATSSGGPNNRYWLNPEVTNIEVLSSIVDK